MSERFTPGPWTAVFPTAIDFRHPLVVGCRGESRVAYLADGGPVRAVEAPEERANARLIAQAPALFACLRMALWHLENPGVPITPASLDNIRTALARALGEDEER